MTKPAEGSRTSSRPREGSRPPDRPRFRPALIGLGIGAGALLGVLNFAALTRGDELPALVALDTFADIAVLAVGIVALVWFAFRSEEQSALLGATQARLAAIVDSAMDAIITVDGEQTVVLFNEAAERIFRIGRSEAIGAPLSRFIPERFHAAHRAHIERFGRTGVTARRMGDVTALVARRADGSEFPIEASISQASDSGRRYFTVILRDITLRKRTEDELSASRARLASILDSAMDAIVTVDEQQNIVLFNRAAEAVFGCPRQEAIGGPLERFLPARFRRAHAGHVASFGRTGTTSRRMGDTTTLWGLRLSDNTEFPIEASISQVVEDGRAFYTVILRDVTIRRQYEEELKRQQRELRTLSAQVLEAREEEKTRIARELHDELGQLLTALKMDLSWLRDRLPNDGSGVAEKAVQMGALLDQTVSATRRISADLRPLLLDDLGLAAAAAWLVEDFGKRSGLEMSLDIPEELDLESLDKAVATTAYRALQESLTNVARHAHAKRVWVVFEADDAELRVAIEDDGRGIAPQDMGKTRSLGLKGMRERVTYLGGTLDIARAPRGGTRVHFRVPLRNNRQNNGEATTA